MIRWFGLKKGTNYSIDKYLNQLKGTNKNNLVCKDPIGSENDQLSSESRLSTSKNEHKHSKGSVSNLKTSLNMFQEM